MKAGQNTEHYKHLRTVGLTLAGAATALLIARLLNPLPSLSGRTASESDTGAEGTSLARTFVALTTAHPGLTGVHLLRRPDDAFAARIRLVQAAEHTLDLQYYIWGNDLSGRWLLSELVRAADRGVRVRLLLDDNGIASLDAIIAAVSLHALIEIRIFNPFATRLLKSMSYVTDFGRVNRRMHNKSLTVDGQVAVLGGRNIGDGYFGSADDELMIDLDVAAIGSAVAETGVQFDQYWASGSAYPAERLLPSADGAMLESIRSGRFIEDDDALGRRYREALERGGFIQPLRASDADFEWGRCKVLSDDPAKTLRESRREDAVGVEVRRWLCGVRSSLTIISGYFVPTRNGVRLLTRLAEAGIDVRIVTNAFAATDVRIVHAGYAGHRSKLLRAGVRLFEIRPDARSSDVGRHRRGGGTRFSGVGQALHAKTFIADGREVAVGSFNFDPRSADLNTELLLLVESPVIAAMLKRDLDHYLPGAAYEVTLDHGQLRWNFHDGERAVTTRNEPKMSIIDRFVIRTLSLFPIERLL